MELTNHTYLRSRVDMHIADSLRQKASSKIASGGMQNARDDSGGFTAAVRLKSNQFMLQSKRANIQNSLSYLHSQRDAIENARKIVEEISLVKLKYDDPTLNASDKQHLNKEFLELTEEMITLKQQTFNGVSLFATKVDGIIVSLSEHVELVGEGVLTLVVEHQQVALLVVRGLHNRLINILDLTFQPTLPPQFHLVFQSEWAMYMEI